MISVRNRSSQIGQYLKASSCVVASQSRPVPGPVQLVGTLDAVKVPGEAVALTAGALGRSLPHRPQMLAVSGSMSTPFQIRLAHTDIRVPSFDDYRWDSRKAANKQSEKTEQKIKTSSYIIGSGLTMVSLYSAKNSVALFVESMGTSADLLALAKIEIDITSIPEGKNITFKWRGKPLFVKHRTQAEIERERAVNLGELRDPQHDNDRAVNPEYLVVIGVCTHLGCVPIANAGDFGGYYCPCHGSHYDASGRIRKGPAPLNLQVPEHRFADEKTLIVG